MLVLGLPSVTHVLFNLRFIQIDSQTLCYICIFRVNINPSHLNTNSTVNGQVKLSKMVTWIDLCFALGVDIYLLNTLCLVVLSNPVNSLPADIALCIHRFVIFDEVVLNNSVLLFWIQDVCSKAMISCHMIGSVLFILFCCVFCWHGSTFVLFIHLRIHLKKKVCCLCYCQKMP